MSKQILFGTIQGSIVIALVTFLMSCGGGGGRKSESGPGIGGDTTPPSVSSTSPANGDTQVAPNSVITATFSEPINPALLSSNTFIVNILGSGLTPVSGSITYAEQTRTATFKPNSNLNTNTTYSVTLTTGVEDLAGNPMAAPYSWSFGTGAAVDNIAPSFLNGDPQLIVQATSSNSVSLSWNAATDNTTPSGQIRYVICQSTSSTDCTQDPFPAPGGAIFIYETLAGATSYPIPGLNSNTAYFFVVRAKDLVNLMDSNGAQKSVTTPGSFKSLSASLNNSFSSSPASDPSIAAVGTTIYVTWQEGNIGAIYYRTFDTTQPLAQRVWSPAAGSAALKVATSTNPQKQPRLVPDRSNPPVPYVTYTECDPTCKVYVRKWNGAGWVLVGAGALNIDSTKFAEQATISFDGNNTPYVAWVEKDASAVNQLRVSYFDGTNWIPDGSTLNQDSAKNSNSPAIAINGTTIRVGWAECVATNSSKCQIFVKGWTGTAWALVGATSLNVGDFQFIQASTPSLAFINNVLHVSWHEGNTVYVRQEQGGGFTAVGALSNSVSASSNTPISGTATGSQTLYLIFAENNSNPQTGPSLIVKKWNGTNAWVTEGITGTNPTGALNMTGGNGTTITSSITFVGGTPYIAWTETGSCLSPNQCGQNNTADAQLYVKRLE